MDAATLVPDADVAVADDVLPQTEPLSSTSSERIPVLYLNHSAQVSGGEASLRSLLWGLRRADLPIDPIVALPDGGPFSELLRDEGWNVTLAPLRRLHRPRGIIDGMTSLLHVLQTAPLICRLVDQSGAKIVHSNSTTAHLVGGVAGERTGRPTIWHCRDLVPLARLAPQLANKATRVIAISGCVAEMLEKEGVPHDKIVVVHNGIDTDEWRPKARSHLRESLAIPDDAFLFGVVGQLVPWKNHAAFIEAAAQIAQDENCSRARFAIIGGDLWGEQAPYVKELRELVKKHELVDRFNFIPFQHDGADAIGALDALVHPAHDEPFGRVLMEAMALSKPVIAMNENGPREIVTHETDGLLVSPEDENGLAGAMKRLLLDEELRAHLKQHARPSIESKFHIADYASKIADIYRQLSN
jgi:glycosyltransferase involved in cell wall biosynthesis